MSNIKFSLVLKVVLALFMCLILMGYLMYRQEGAGRGRLKGKVVTEAGEPIPNAKVILRSPKYKSTITKTTDKDGNWAVMGIQGGHWDIDITANGFYPKAISTTVSEVLRNKPIIINLKESEKDVFTAEEAEKMKKLIAKGNEYFAQKEYEAALKEFEKILLEHPELERIHLYIGNCYKEMEDMDKAIAAFEKYWQKNPDSSEANLSMADVYILKGESEKALDFLEKLDINLITDPAMSYNFGEAYFSLGQPDNAIKFFSCALSLNPEFSEAYYKLGLAYLNKGDIENARLNLEKFIEMAPDSPDAEIAKQFLKSIEESNR